MSQGLKKDKQVSVPSVLGLIIYTVPDKPFKRNRGFAVGTRVEI